MNDQTATPATEAHTAEASIDESRTNEAYIDKARPSRFRETVPTVALAVLSGLIVLSLLVVASRHIGHVSDGVTRDERRDRDAAYCATSAAYTEAKAVEANGIESVLTTDAVAGYDRLLASARAAAQLSGAKEDKADFRTLDDLIGATSRLRSYAVANTDADSYMPSEAKAFVTAFHTAGDKAAALCTR